MLRKTKMSVEKEHVICQNCHYQYSYLYEDKSKRANVKTTYEKLAKKDPTVIKKTHANLKDAYQPCPYCGFVQKWMYELRQRMLVKEFFIVAGVSVILIVGCVFFGVLFSSEGTGNMGSVFASVLDKTLLYFLLLGIGSIAYFIWTFLIWDPNRKVDRSSYEGARTKQVDRNALTESTLEYEAAAKVDAGPVKKTKRVMVSLGVKIVMSILATCGLVAFLSPSLFPEMISELNNRGFMMLPFYIGVGCFLLSMVSPAFFNLFNQDKSRTVL